MITAVQQKRSYQWIYHFSGWLSMFGVLTVFGPLFPLFCDALGMSKTKIGFVLAILPFSYLISVFVSDWVMAHGPKRTLIQFYSVRCLFVLGLPLAVWFAKRYGGDLAFLWVATMIFLFSVCRIVGETGWWPWWLELISDRVRGKVEALNSIAAGIGIIAALLLAVLIVKIWPGLAGYSLAMYVGILFAAVGLILIARAAGGQAQKVEKRNWKLVKAAQEAWRNSRFRAWTPGGVLISMVAAVLAFLPLYLSKQVGFSDDRIILFSFCFQVGTLASAFFWGWSADRFGSKPVLISSLTGCCLLPILLFLLPRMGQQSAIITGLVYAFFGIVWQGLTAGLNRYFFVSVLPTTRNPAFCTSMNMSLQNIVVGTCSFFYGWLLDAMQAVKFDWRFLHLDSFSVLFAIMFVCCLGAFFIYRRVPADNAIPAGQFMSFFFEGNPLLAFSSMARYHFSEDESSRLELTRRLGDAKSRLTVEELLDAANDPNFNVRYEAIVSMARMPADAKLINALALAVRSREPGVSEAACWALGRMGDRRALPVLREMLKCEYALLRSQCARALAKLNDQESVPEIVAAMKSERNPNIRAGFATALGRLRCKETFPAMLDLLRALKDDRLRGDVALAVVRIVGGEHRFVRLWKRSRSDFETTCAEELLEIETKIAPSAVIPPEFRRLAGEGVKQFEQRHAAAGAAAIGAMLKQLPRNGFEPLLADLVKECDAQIGAQGGERGDYIMLALNALHLGILALLREERKKKLLS